MGFFSSRKAEANDTYLAATTTNDDRSVSHVIRSRFYGKNKGKERDEQPPLSYNTRTTQILSPAHGSTQLSPLSRASNESTSGAGPSILHIERNNQLLPSTPPKKGKHVMSNTCSPSAPSPRLRDRSYAVRQGGSVQVSTLPRKPADTVTVTLAQRLNELAIANSEGLLNDDEYRLLRQNLFERFATSAVVPTEASVVPVSRQRPRGIGSTPDGKSISRPLSNFQVEISRSPSIRSKTSVTAGVASFLRRATSRRTPSGSNDYSETSSIFSSVSTTSNVFKRGQSKKSSNSSVHTTTSRPQADTISISSRKTGAGSQSDHLPHFPSSISRSNTSIRHLATPPSSFPIRGVGNDSARNTGSINDLFDEERLKTAVEIRQEILLVEAEARRLMDAFNGLEMTTLAKLQRYQGRETLQENGGPIGSPSTLASEERTQKRVAVVDNDAVSVQSATSTGTTPSMARSTQPGRRAQARGGLNVSASLNSAKLGSLHRKNSISSIGSQEQKIGWKNKVPPVPALPESYGHLGGGGGSMSNVSLVRSTSYLTMSVVPEDEAEGKNEMDDIRQRREEVLQRYEARLEYLRAKLRGAELHEKLARK